MTKAVQSRLGQAQDRGERRREAGADRLRRGRHRRRQQVPARRGGADRDARHRQHAVREAQLARLQRGAREARPGRGRRRRSRALTDVRANAATATCSSSRSAAVRARATVGEVSDALEAAWGRHRADTQKVSGVYARRATTAPQAGTQLKREIDAFADDEGRRPRVMVAKLGQDGHDRGAKVVATRVRRPRLRRRHRPAVPDAEECARQAIENDVHAIGVSTLAAGHKTLVPALIEALSKQGADDIVVFVGGVIPRRTTSSSTSAGVAGHLRAGHADPGERQGRARADPRSARSPAARPDARGRIARCCARADQDLARPGARRARAREAQPPRARQGDHAARVDAAPTTARAPTRCSTALLPHDAARRFGMGIIGRARRRQVDVHRGARPAPDRRKAIASRCSRSTRSSGLRRIDPRRQDAHGAALASTRHAFIRPCPSGGTLGGVAATTREAMLRRRGGGIRRRDRRDRRRRPERDRRRRHDRLFVLLQLPQRRRRPAGDQEGRVELADLVVVNKADLDRRRPRRARWRRSSRRCTLRRAPRSTALEAARCWRRAPLRARRDRRGSGRPSSAFRDAQDARGALQEQRTRPGARVDVGSHRRRPARRVSRRRRRARAARRHARRGRCRARPVSVAARRLLRRASPRAAQLAVPTTTD